MARLPPMQVRISADTSALSRGLKHASNALIVFGRLATTGAAVAAAGFASAAAAATAAAVAVVKVASAIDKTAKSASRLGMSVGEFAQLEYAAQLSGVSVEKLTTAMTALNRNMAAAGDTTASKTFELLGVSVRDASGALRDNNDVLADFADKISQYEDGAAKAALVTNVFGRGSADLIPMLNEGAAGMQAMADEARDLGAVMSGRLGKSSEALMTNVDRLKTAFWGVMVQVGEKLIPVFADWTSSLMDWIKEGRVVDTVANAIIGTVKVLSGVVVILTAEWRKLVEVFSMLLDMATGDLWNGNMTARWQNMQQSLAKINADMRADLEHTQAVLSTTADAVGLGDQSSGKQQAPTLTANETTAKRSDRASGEDPLVRQLERLREHLMNRFELLEHHHAEEQEMLNQAREKELISAEEHARLMLAIQQRYVNDRNKLLAAEQIGQANAILGGTGKILSAIGQRNEKMLKAAKVFEAANAMVKAYAAASQVLADPTLPWYAKIAAAASVLAQGIGFANAISGISSSGGGKSGGGGRSSSSGLGASAASGGGSVSGRSTATTINLHGGDLFNRSQVVALISQINEVLEDGATIRIGA